MTTVCFTGSRPIKLPWGYDETDARCCNLKAELKRNIELLIQRGATRFITGCAEGVDTYCAEAVLALNAPGVTLECAVPCTDQDSAWKPASKRRYRELLQRAHVVTILSDAYTAGCMAQRNRYMVDQADLVLACTGGGFGGTANTVAYARKKGKQVIIIPIDGGSCL